MKFLVEKGWGQALHQRLWSGSKENAQGEARQRAHLRDELLREAGGEQQRTFEELKAALEKTKDRDLEAAIGQWLAKGIRLKVLPRVEGRTSLFEGKNRGLAGGAKLGGTPAEGSNFQWKMLQHRRLPDSNNKGSAVSARPRFLV